MDYLHLDMVSKYAIHMRGLDRRCISMIGGNIKWKFGKKKPHCPLMKEGA